MIEVRVKVPGYFVSDELTFLVVQCLFEMGQIDIFVRDMITTYGIVFFVVTFFIVLITRKWSSIRKKVFHSYLTGFEVECGVLALPYKMHLLNPLYQIVSSDAVLRAKGDIRILEIGVKTGENILFYPKGTHLIAVDWNIKLAEYLAKGNRSEDFSHVMIERIIIGDGGSMPEIATGSVDAVVTTRALCSAASVRATLREIKRVLAPGGKYFFMEHILSPECTFIRCCQKVLAHTRIWRTLFGNCRLDFDPIPEIRNTGFERVLCTSVTLEGYTANPILFALSREHVFGAATR